MRLTKNTYIQVRMCIRGHINFKGHSYKILVEEFAIILVSFQAKKQKPLSVQLKFCASIIKELFSKKHSVSSFVVVN